MDSSDRRPIIIPVIVCILALGALTRSNALATVRAVDALLIFVAGASAGVALARVLPTRKP
jgi:hypothetical protein